MLFNQIRGKITTKIAHTQIFEREILANRIIYSMLEG